MDLLSLVGLATQRRGDYFTQAEALAKKAKTQPVLEERMVTEARVLVKGLRDKLFRFEEYERVLLDKTLVAALASVYLGAKSAKPREKMEKAWPTVVGDLLPPLVKFLAETRTYLDSGVLLQGDKTLEFEEEGDYNLPDGDFEAEGIEEAQQGRAVGKTWPALFGRVSRYTATPTYSFFNLGNYLVKAEQGYTEMMRVARKDNKTCNDCIDFAARGWQPIGSLPMPGRDCRCHDRCRCYIDYR